MDRNDREAIEALFAKLRAVEETAPPRDPEAEALIEGGLARQRGAAYRMAQTIVAQERALEAAARRIKALEGQGGGGSFLGDLFGGGASAPRPRAAPPPQAVQRGGFLAGAAQTALGVAGGFLVADMISGAFGGAAEASDWGADASGGMDDGGDFDFDL